jgi:hypothetical protein
MLNIYETLYQGRSNLKEVFFPPPLKAAFESNMHTALRNDCHSRKGEKHLFNE